MTGVERVDVAVVGAGHAGLAMSRVLREHEVDHVVLEADRVAERWRSERWDSFCLLTPNWATWLPHWRYDGPEPDGFMSGPQVVEYLERFAASFDAPVREGVRVESLESGNGAGGFVLRTSAGELRAGAVVAATGPFQSPRLPAAARELPAGIVQLHSSAYRSPQALPDGAVLVVGTGASGQQIADELVHAGRRVYISVGRNRRVPRVYRGRDHFWWLENTGFYDKTADDVPPERQRGGASPALTGGRGGRYDLDLRAMAARGATLLGRVRGVEGTRLLLAGDLAESVGRGDRAYGEFVEWAEGRVPPDAGDLDAPEPRPELPDPPELARPLRELDLAAAGVSAVIWATGFRPAFSEWLRLPVLDAEGRPRHHRGATRCPGFYFLGLHWLHRQRSAFIRGAEEDARHLAGLIARRREVHA